MCTLAAPDSKKWKNLNVNKTKASRHWSSPRAPTQLELAKDLQIPWRGALKTYRRSGLVPKVRILRKRGKMVWRFLMIRGGHQWSTPLRSWSRDIIKSFQPIKSRKYSHQVSKDQPRINSEFIRNMLTFVLPVEIELLQPNQEWNRWRKSKMTKAILKSLARHLGKIYLRIQLGQLVLQQSPSASNRQDL